MISINQNKNTTNLSFPTNLINDTYVDKFVKYLRFAELSSKNKLKQKNAVSIVNEMKNDWWEKNEKTFLKGIRK